MMLVSSQLASRRLTRSLLLTSSSFHSALKRQLKADKKAKEKETKVVTEVGMLSRRRGCGLLLRVLPSPVETRFQQQESQRGTD